MLPLKYLVNVVSLFICSALASDVNIVNVAQEQRVQYARDDYLNELLEKALVSAQYPAEINPVLIHPHQQRTLIALGTKNLDLYWSMSSPERESLAIAIKIPLFKGYIGKRALLTSKNSIARFKGITSLGQLGKLSAVQGHDWPDTKIMAFNGLHIRPFANYQAMFALTSAGRIDYFPRSFIEVNSELLANKESNLVIVPNLYISYPTGFYYFVSNSKPELAVAIEKGLKIMQKNGEFDTLFDEYFAKDLNTLPYEKGKTVELKLDNPYF
ncbi:substrate-binding periplasmic protein [Pseudoalteromonas sp. NZS11]|uniref:substrate-binding periplasmic protein n=1 Tax=Pseudoalteromonas sp. NZS11 TaxID=2792049 RepID=UPI0018CCAC80|nr:transporter substrate-binding domain-containing protein [Pseudoalteromonas sp. NZS11]MBH0081016.1 transporter substrate-binding domain-containing protein [Pseudoalteromonas sp. NZS11]